MFKIITTLSFVLIAFISLAQPWKNQLSLDVKLEPLKNGEYDVVIQAKPASGYHVFSVNHDPEKADFTGLPTTITIDANKNLKLVGKLIETSKPETHVDEFGTSLYFEKPVTFKQRVKVLTDQKTTGNFIIGGQICDEKGCVFFEKPITLVFNADKKESAAVDTDVNNLAGSLSASMNDSLDDKKTVESDSSTLNNETISQSKQTEKKSEDSLWLILLAGFGGGLIALLTPCVFPMIPMTVTFFTKQSGSRKKGIINAFIYGLSIIGIYVTIGLVITAILGPSGLNDLSTNVWMNLIFFLIFIVFAISFLGAFEIRMPSSWVNKADGKADKGGLIGIFFMAFTLSLVSFSCTGPIIGTLLVESSQSGSLLGPAIGMVGFSAALAIPFTLFAIFPSWLSSLPQSGGWLNSVKVVLGLLELALAMKFLSGIDLAYHWNVITREVFVAIWIVIFFLMGFYLLGKIQFSHDSPVQKLSVTRFFFALFAFIFAVYLVPGMWGAPLKLIDGVAPPRSHSEDNFRFVKGDSEGATAVLDPLMQKYGQYMHEVDEGIKVFHDLDQAKAYAKEANKPILVDFTGYNCPNCRRTESTVWTNDAIRPLLKNDYVIASLYVDDKTQLPQSEWKYSDVMEMEIRTVGNKWSDYQVRRYKQLSQPLYVITDPDGNDLSAPIGYEPNIEKYKSFLQSGLDLMKK